MDENDRILTLNTLERDKIDEEFLPFLDLINRFTFVVTAQCCVGHMEYKNDLIEKPPTGAGHWGYLQLLMEEAVATWLMEQIEDWAWLWIPYSQLWMEGSTPPGITDAGSIELTFAWDASAWPQPAHDIVAALEAFDGRRKEEE